MISINRRKGKVIKRQRAITTPTIKPQSTVRSEKFVPSKPSAHRPDNNRLRTTDRRPLSESGRIATSPTGLVSFDDFG